MARFFFKWLSRHLKSDCTPLWWVPTGPKWRGGRVGTHKPRGWHNKKMKNMTFLKKNHLKKNFLKKKYFFSFLFIKSQVYWYPQDPLAIVVTWVPITGVQSVFMCLRANYYFFFLFRNSAKNHRFFLFCLQTHNIIWKPILTPNFSSFCLQIAKKIKKIHFWKIRWVFCVWSRLCY